MGWSVEVHERQRLAEAAAAKRPRRTAPEQLHPLESGVWQVAAGSKTVTALAAALLAALWARHSARQQRLQTPQRPESLLGRISGAIAARLQALGVTDILKRGRGCGPSSGGSGKQRQRKPAPRPSASRAAGEAALQRSSAAAAAAAQPAAGASVAAEPSAAATASAAQLADSSSGGKGSGSLSSPQQPGAYLDVAPGSAPVAPAQPPPHARPAEQRGGQRKQKGKGKRKK